MIKLSICVPHYKEPWEVCKPLFDSIAVQKGVSLTDVEIVFVNDGEKMFDIPVNDYPFLTSVYTIPHKGVSAARNKAMDEAIGEYVMFCDCDDYFSSMYGLHLIFSAMQEGFETLTSSFIEENVDEVLKLLRHDNDCTFVHGKVYNKAFLTEKNLRWNEELKVHEDGYFTSCALMSSTNRKTINAPFYTWHWNENSVARKPDFNHKSYPQLIESRAAICQWRLENGFISEYMDGVVQTVMEAYYEILLMQNEHHITRTEVAFKKFWERYKSAFIESARTNVSTIAQECRASAQKRGLVLEKVTLFEWLKHIDNDVK